MTAISFLTELETILVFKLSATVFILLLFACLRWAVSRAISNYAAAHKFSPGRIASTRRSVGVISFLLLAGALAVVWSIRLQSLMVASGAIMATVGIAFFAGWSILSNVTAGIIMFWRFPIHVGDKVGMVNDKTFAAVVREFTPFYIILEDAEENIVTLPNALTLQQMFIVYKDGNPEKAGPAPDEAGPDSCTSSSG